MDKIEFTLFVLLISFLIYWIGAGESQRHTSRKHEEQKARRETAGQFAPNSFGLISKDFVGTMGSPDERIRQAQEARTKREWEDVIREANGPTL